MPEPQEFRTDLLSLAAAAIMDGHPVERIEPLPGWKSSPRGEWVFPDPEGRIEKLRRAYMSEELRVEPRRFTTALAEARNQMFAWVDEQR